MSHVCFCFSVLTCPDDHHAFCFYLLFTGLVAHSDLDERALEALKEFNEEGALQVLVQFKESDLSHVQVSVTRSFIKNVSCRTKTVKYFLLCTDCSSKQ